MRTLLLTVLCLSFLRAAAWAQEAAPPPLPPAPQPAATPATPTAPTTPPASPATPAGQFKITFDPSIQTGPYSGRIYLALNKSTTVEPRKLMGNWYAKHPVFALDAKDIPPGGSVTVDASWLAYPSPLAEVEPGVYSVQAVARRNTDVPLPGSAHGDLYSEPTTIDLSHGHSGTVELKLTKTAVEPPFPESDRVKEFSIVSPLLSKFYGKEVHTKAGVILPKNWRDDPTAHFPTVYFIGGFGTNHRFAAKLESMLPKSADEVMVIIPDASGPFGHTGLADSANNGPRAQSFIEELIPAVEAKFHGPLNAETRWITGISSGGWSCLWVTINYPEYFGQCWSFCPDPVDFRDFQKVNLYADNANLYKDDSGSRRPLSHNFKDVTISYDDFCRQARVIGIGGQIHAFEAICSERGPDGQPRPLFNRDTGAIDPDVAKSWQKYDIRLALEGTWPTLGPRLKDKIRLYAGELDNFYLEGAVRSLKTSLKELGSDADIHIVPKMGHDIPPAPFRVMFQICRDRAAGSSNVPMLPLR